MKHLKKWAALLCAAVLCAALAGCGAALPDGVAEDDAAAWAEATVRQLNGKDYDALCAVMTQEMADALSPDALAEAWEPVLEQAGAFDSIVKTTLAGKDGYAVAVVQAQYANAALTFTLSYTPEGRLAGLFFK